MVSTSRLANLFGIISAVGIQQRECAEAGIPLSVHALTMSLGVHLYYDLNRRGWKIYGDVSQVTLAICWRRQGEDLADS
jgi:hypothetical protein